MSVIVDLSIFPLDAEGTSLSPYVARVVDVIKRSGLAYQPGPMGTAVEGEWDEVLALVDRCYRELEPDAERIYMNIKVDSRSGRSGGLEGKVASVLGKSSEAS